MQNRGFEGGASGWVISGLQVVSRVLIAITDSHFLASNTHENSQASKTDKRFCPAYKLFTFSSGRAIARVVSWKVAELLSFCESANNVFQREKTRRLEKIKCLQPIKRLVAKVCRAKGHSSDNKNIRVRKIGFSLEGEEEDILEGLKKVYKEVHKHKKVEINGEGWVRCAFCKKDETLHLAANRLKTRSEELALISNASSLSIMSPL
jgi:hypothetical protein